MARLRTIAGLVLAALVAGCSGSSGASRSLSFDSRSAKAIVLVGTSTNRVQQEEIRAGRRLSTFWMEFDPARQRLVPDGKTFVTAVDGGVFSKPAYLTPTVTVIEVDPGSYALVGAGFPHLMTTYVSPRPTKLLNGDASRRQSWHHTVDPRVHVDPEAEIDRQRNFVFTVHPGEILYIGHFEFQKWAYLDSLRSYDVTQDTAAARAALEGYPGISGALVTHDRNKPPQQVSR